MTKLLGEESNNQDGSARYRAKITEKQQQYEEELKKLQESYHEKTQDDGKKQSESTDSSKKGEAQRSREKEVNVSKKKNIFKIITEAFTLVVQPKKWDAIVEDLKALFGGRLDDVLLLKELKSNNEKIASLLHHLKDKNRISQELRIAALMREIITMGKISKVHAVRMLAIQNGFIASLNSKYTNEFQNLSRERNIQIQIDKPQMQKSIPQNVLEAAKQLTAESKASSQAIAPSGLKPVILDWQHEYQINNPPHPVHHVNLLKPIEKMLRVAESFIVKYLINPIGNAIKDIAVDITSDLMNSQRSDSHHFNNKRLCPNMDGWRYSNVQCTISTRRPSTNITHANATQHTIRYESLP